NFTLSLHDALPICSGKHNAGRILLDNFVFELRPLVEYVNCFLHKDSKGKQFACFSEKNIFNSTLKVRSKQRYQKTINRITTKKLINYLGYQHYKITFQ